MNKKILTTLASLSFAFYLGACGDDSSSSANIECLDNENCLDDELSSDSDDAESSSSAKSTKDKSSSSVKAKSSSSEKAKSSSSEKAKSSSSAKAKSSSSKNDAKSSSSEEILDESSSSEEEPESSSSVELKITYLSETPNAADLEVSGDTLFAVFQRSYSDGSFTLLYQNGLVALFNLKDGSLLDTIPLVTKNPQTIKMVNGSLYVGTTGEYNPDTWGTDADDTRGIEKIDLKNKTSELWIGGSKLGAGVQSFDVNAETGVAYVVVNKGYPGGMSAEMPVLEVDLASKSVTNIDGIYDASGTVCVDPKSSTVYIGDRGSYEEMTGWMAYSYDGTSLTALYDEEDYFGYQPASIAVAGGVVFVYISDYYSSGRLYWIENGNLSEKSIEFSTDTKLVAVNDKLYVLDRKDAGSISNVNISKKKVAWQHALAKENPYDIVAINKSSAWVAMYNVAEIRKISLSDGSTISSIDTKELSAKNVEVVTEE